MYYDYPPPTYLEYPILIAQGEFQNQNRVDPDVIEMNVKSIPSGLGGQTPQTALNSCCVCVSDWRPAIIFTSAQHMH